MTHKLSNIFCLVAHFDKNGNPLPACRKCLRCGEWIAHEKQKGDCHDELSSKLQRLADAP